MEIRSSKRWGKFPVPLVSHPDNRVAKRYLPEAPWSLALIAAVGSVLILCAGFAGGSGAVLWVAAASAALIASLGMLVSRRIEALSVEIGQLHEDKERSVREALVDSLTGLPNRLAFRTHLEAEMSAGSEDATVVLFADLDRFKEVNDRLGHDAGDQLLEEIARRFSEQMQPGDLLARLGGDEFAAILTGPDATERTKPIVQAMISRAQEPFRIKDTVVGVGVSVGMASARASEASCEELLRRADIAMYRAKADREESFASFVDEMDDSIRLSRAMRADLAMGLGRGDLRLDYQPIINARSGQIVSAEALMRWTHPQEGELSPGRFITLAEESGQIIELGEWALDRVLETIQQLNGLPVAINVSPVQFRHHAFATSVSDKLLKSGLSPNLLRIEITEGVLISHTDAAKRTIRHLRDIGVDVILDDFGTGYSSLSYLQTFQFDEVKIDRSFVRNLGRQNNSARLARAIIDMGHGLEMSVTAEGIENPQQAQLLKLLGCDKLQGFYLGVPASIQDLQRRLEEQQQPEAPVIASPARSRTA